MKKLLLGIIIILIIILTGITIVNGLKIGNLNILGIKEIKNKNDQLDTSIKQATKLASTDYEKKLDDLDDQIKKLQDEKKNYEDMVSVSTESEVTAANQSFDNKIEFLLVRIDNHAKREGVTMTMNVVKSSSGAKDVYNLDFKVTGGYAQIEEFITDIEDDSKLGYKIENFKMSSSSENGNVVQASFICKDITITGITSNLNTSSTKTINDEKTETK